MKTQGFIFIAMLAIVACNSTSTEEVQKIKSLAQQDSIKAIQANQKDSLITAYLTDLNDIQENLDRIKQREKIITMKSPEMNSGDPNNKQAVVAEIKELDDWIVANDKKINRLQRNLKSMNAKNSKLESLVEHLTQEVTEKDEEIAQLQGKLGKANDSLRFLTVQLNDSITTIKKQRADIALLNTVYYITGTMKELQDKGIINKEGGFIGLGRVGELNPSVDNTAFTKTSQIDFKGVNLHGKFRRFITTHPVKAYEIITNGKTDSLAINMPASFWSESKYLVIATR
jgi:hypothetical protein